MKKMLTTPSLLRKSAPPWTLLHRHPSDHRKCKRSHHHHHPGSYRRRRSPLRKSRSHQRLRGARATALWGVTKGRTSERSSGEKLRVLRAVFHFSDACRPGRDHGACCSSPVLLLLTTVHACGNVLCDSVPCTNPLSSLSRPCRLSPSWLCCEQGCSVLLGMDSAKIVVVSAQPAACFGAIHHLGPACNRVVGPVTSPRMLSPFLPEASADAGRRYCWSRIFSCCGLVVAKMVNGQKCPECLRLKPGAAAAAAASACPSPTATWACPTTVTSRCGHWTC